MTKKDFSAKVNELCKYINSCTRDNMRAQLYERNIKDPFTYAGWCERGFECNLREDYKRKTTFTADFSIAEWCVPMEGMKAISDTLKNALNNWRDSIEFFAELIIVLNMKSWEHAARCNYNYSRMYSELYLDVKCLYFDWFDESHKKHGEAMDYYFKYVD